MKNIDRTGLQSLMEREQKKFVEERPKSKALLERARKSLPAGVPMKIKKPDASTVAGVWVQGDTFSFSPSQTN
jgi:hypothetical protein